MRASLMVLAVLLWIGTAPASGADAWEDRLPGEPLPGLAVLPPLPTGSLDVDQTLADAWAAVPSPLSDTMLPPDVPTGVFDLGETLDEVTGMDLPHTGLVVDLPGEPEVLDAVPEVETPLDPTLEDWGLDHAHPVAIRDAALRHAEDAATRLAGATAALPAVVVAVPQPPPAPVAVPVADPPAPPTVEARPADAGAAVEGAVRDLGLMARDLPVAGTVERLYADPLAGTGGARADRVPLATGAAGTAGSAAHGGLAGASGALLAGATPHHAATLPPAPAAATWRAGVAASLGPSALGPGAEAAFLAAVGAAAALLALRPLLALYHRLAPSRLLEQPTRRRIHEAIAAHPGIRVGTLQASLGLNYNTVLRHVRTLERHGFVHSEGAGQRRWFATSVALGPEQRAAAVATASPTVRQVLAYLAPRGAADLPTLRRDLGLPRSTASDAVARLARAGLVGVERRGTVVLIRAYGAHGPSSAGRGVPGAHSTA